MPFQLSDPIYSSPTTAPTAQLARPLASYGNPNSFNQPPHFQSERPWSTAAPSSFTVQDRVYHDPSPNTRFPSVRPVSTPTSDLHPNSSELGTTLDVPHTQSTTAPNGEIRISPAGAVPSQDRVYFQQQKALQTYGTAAPPSYEHSSNDQGYT
jgi:hypothetical protein